MGSTPDRGVKQNLKPSVHKRSEPLFGVVTACLLDNEPTSCVSAARLSGLATNPKRERVLIGRMSRTEQTRNPVIYPCPG